MKIIDRIKKYIDEKGISNAKFYKETGLSNGYLDKVQNFGADKIESIISVYNDINLEWLITGKGKMLIENDDKKTILKSAVGIPLIPLDAMAGFASGERSILELECERFVVPTFKGADFLITVKGSSMYPKYNSGDIVACKKLNVRDIFFQWNKVYVLDTEQGALIKRIRKGKDKEHILVVSDNEKYEPFDLHLSKLQAIALVIGCIRLE